MAKYDRDSIEEKCTEVFELVTQDIEGLALALTLATQLLEERLVEPEDLLRVIADHSEEAPLTIH